MEEPCTIRTYGSRHQSMNNSYTNVDGGGMHGTFRTAQLLLSLPEHAKPPCHGI